MNKTGFGFLRLPMLENKDEKCVDYPLLNKMVDRFLELGGTYFDTAYTYLDGLSEEAIRKSLVDRYPRNCFRLADKLPGYQVKSYEECQAYFEESLRRCGVTFFDVYLLHWLNDRNFAIAEEMDQFRFLREVKAAGLASQIGFSYHDGPELLDTILTKHPEVDYVQLQINYIDWDSPSLQARQCYEIAVKHGKSVIVMEPVKGGNLVKLPPDAEMLLCSLPTQRSNASRAIHFCSDLSCVEVVLSGMNALEQVEDNLQNFPPLTVKEQTALLEAAAVIRSNTAVPCTGCGYCVSHCPIGMPIPRYFSLYNDYARDPGDAWKMQHAYHTLAKSHAPASSCLECQQCEANCPQKIKITDFLKKTCHVFEAAT